MYYKLVEEMRAAQKDGQPQSEWIPWAEVSKSDLCIARDVAFTLLTVERSHAGLASDFKEPQGLPHVRKGCGENSRILQHQARERGYQIQLVPGLVRLEGRPLTMKLRPRPESESTHTTLAHKHKHTTPPDRHLRSLARAVCVPARVWLLLHMIPGAGVALATCSQTFCLFGSLSTTTRPRTIRSVPSSRISP